MTNGKLGLAVLGVLAMSVGAVAQPVGISDVRPLHLEPIMGPGEANAGVRSPDEPRPVGQVLETRPRLDKPAEPAFKGQTRAVAARTHAAFAETVMAHGFSRAWALVVLPDGRLLVTEKSGGMRIVTPDGKVGDFITGGPQDILNYSDAGFFDVVLDPDFAHNRRLFFSYVQQRGDGNGLNVASAVLSADEKSLGDVKTLFTAPGHNNAGHYGGRMLVTPDNKLLVAVGDHFLPGTRIKAQSLDSTFGKVVRINFDGSIPSDNPFAAVRGAEGAIWALGLRNVEGLAYDSKGALWAADIGPQTGDEINLIQPGHNYGWPVIGYGTEYSGALINNARTQWPGMDQPVYYWDPTIAPSGITFYSGSLFPEWKGNLFVASLAGEHLARLILKNGQVVGEERLLQDQHQRIRDVAQGPDGALWVITDNRDGRLIRIASKP